MSLLQQVKDVISTLEDEEKKELYNYLGELLNYGTPASVESTPKETPVPPCSCVKEDEEDEAEENVRFVISKEAPVEPGDASDEESDAPQLLPPRHQPPVATMSAPPQPQPKEEKWFIDRTSQMSFGAETRSEMPSALQTTRYTLDNAKNIVQQYHQTFINPKSTPEYRQAWEDPDYKGSHYTCGFATVLQLQLDPDQRPLKFYGTGTKKVDAEKNAALKACEYLEQTGRLDEMLNKGSSSSKRPVQSSDGLTPENAAGYLMFCKNTFVINDVERPDAVAMPQGGFMAETVVIMPKGKQTFRTDRPRNKKKEARNEADYQAALWVRRTTGVSVPGNMAR